MAHDRDWTLICRRSGTHVGLIRQRLIEKHLYTVLIRADKKVYSATFFGKAIRYMLSKVTSPASTRTPPTEQIKLMFGVHILCLIAFCNADVDGQSTVYKKYSQNNYKLCCFYFLLKSFFLSFFILFIPFLKCRNP